MSLMTHHSRLLTFVIDVPSGAHDKELAFWEGAAGQEPPRIHLDIHADDNAQRWE